MRPLIETAPIAELASRFEMASPDPNRVPWPGRHVEVAGCDLFVRSTPPTGERTEPALYVHGLGGASTNFTDVADLLSPWLDGQSLDLPGFGRSGPSPRGRYSIAAHAAAVTGYLRAADRGPVHLVGNSMGGAAAILVAARAPELVRSLTLISPAVPDLRPKRSTDLLLPLLLVPGLGNRMLAGVDAQAAHLRAKQVIDICFAHPERVPPNRLAEAVADIEARRGLPWANAAFLGSLRGIAANYLSRGARSPWRLMAQITVPTLVIWGELDALVDVAKAPRVAATIGGATLLVLPDVGHTAQLEDPVTTARAILGLVRRVQQADSSRAVGPSSGDRTDRA
jgi:pimeloyl-ACP methyl ester carboxylesterase